MRKILLSFLMLTLLSALPKEAHAARLEELADVQGIRPNQLIGYGLVVGLNNTGDRGQARFTARPPCFVVWAQRWIPRPSKC